jgi:hypothetical protein
VKSRDEFIKILQLRFANMNQTETLKIYVVDDGIESYVTSIKDKKYGISNLPSPNKRSKVEELAGSDDLKEDGEEILEHMMADTEGATEYTVTSNFSIKNSRENGMQVDEITKEEEKDLNEFAKDELSSRASVLIFSKKGSKSAQKELNLEDFKILSVLGKGTFGKVYLTELSEEKKLYAIKAIRKDVLIETEQVESTKLERDIMLECDHPFL